MPLQERERALESVSEGLTHHPADPLLLAMHLSLTAQHNGVNSAPLEAACSSATISLANAGPCIPTSADQPHTTTSHPAAHDASMGVRSGHASMSGTAAANAAEACGDVRPAVDDGVLDGTYDPGCVGSAQAYVAWLALLSVEHNWPAALRRLQQGGGGCFNRVASTVVAELWGQFLSNCRELHQPLTDPDTFACGLKPNLPICCEG